MCNDLVELKKRMTDRTNWLDRVERLSLARHPLAHGGVSLKDNQKENDYLEGQLDLTNRVIAIYYTAMEDGMNGKCYHNE